MTAAGYADLLAKITAGADWIVADELGIEPIDRRAWDMVQSGLGDSLADPRGCAAGDAGAIARLTEGLLLGGFAMQAAATSRPASGAEHQFSHLWDMEHHAHAGAAPSHGFKVGVASVAVARLFEAVMAMPLEAVDVESACASWPQREFVERSVCELFADEDVRNVALRESLAKWIGRDALRAQLMMLRRRWPDLLRRLRAQMPGPSALAAMLEAAGAPSAPQQIGISPARMHLSFYKAFHIRRRFTVLDLCVRAGVLDDALERSSE
jgi:glycerol-1-phosphate dehydrogenase [NAD(P)+]